MKRKIYSNAALMALAVLVGFSAGCKHPNKGLTHIPGPNTIGIGDPKANEMTGKMTDNTIPTAIDSPNGMAPSERHGDLSRFTNRAALAEYVVHFELDRSTIRPNEKSKVEAVASYLKANAGTELLIEGHCDERGTDGYNLGLGERRALALREALVGAGIAADRIQTVSYGEARPAEPGHNEAAWSKNRRGEFVVSGK